MGLTRPSIDTPQDIRIAIQNRLAQDLELILRDHVGQGPAITIRDARPTDFNGGTVLGALTTPVLTADTYNNNVYSAFALSDHQVLGIYGLAVKTGDPVIDELTWVVNDATTGVNVLTQAWCNTVDARVFFYPAIVWPFNSTVQVNMLSHAGALVGANVIEWLGIIAETQSAYSSVPKLLVPLKTGTAAIPGWLG